MLAHERLVVIGGANQHVGVIDRRDVVQYDGRIALEPPQLRSLHGRALKRRAEIRRRHRQYVARKCVCILTSDHVTRRKQRLFRQSLSELHVPRTARLGDLAV